MPNISTNDDIRRVFDAVLASTELGHGTCTLTVTHDDAGVNLDFYAAYTIATSDKSDAGVIGVALLKTEDGFSVRHVNEHGHPIDNPGRKYFDSHPVFGSISDGMLSNQHMVRIPRFYVRGGRLNHGPLNGAQAWFISDKPRSGFHLHSAFRSPNHPDGAPYFWVGKYQGSIQDDSLVSVPGQMPAVNMDFDEFLGKVRRHNTGGTDGWGLWTAQQASAIDWLYLVEHASFDSQATTGDGRTLASGAAAVDAPDVAEAAYRGIVGLWGNVWQWVDGLKIEGGDLKVMVDHKNRTWQRVAAKPHDGGWHPAEFAAPEDADDLFIATRCTQDEDDAVCPSVHYYQHGEGEYLPLRGGSWGGGSGAGVFALYLYNPRTYSDTIVGSRPAFVI